MAPIVIITKGRMPNYAFLISPLLTTFSNKGKWFDRGNPLSYNPKALQSAPRLTFINKRDSIQVQFSCFFFSSWQKRISLRDMARIVSLESRKAHHIRAKMEWMEYGLLVG